MATGNITSRTDEYKLNMDLGATFRVGFKPGFKDEFGQHYWDLVDNRLSFVVYDGKREWVRDFSDHISLQAGVAYLTLSAAETSQFFARHRRYEWYLDIHLSSGDIKRLTHGPLYVSPVGV